MRMGASPQRRAVIRRHENSPVTVLRQRFEQRPDNVAVDLFERLDLGVGPAFVRRLVRDQFSKDPSQWLPETPMRRHHYLYARTTYLARPDILAADQPTLWESHRPVSGGAVGKMLQEIIDKAARLKLKRESKSKPPRKRSPRPPR